MTQLHDVLMAALASHGHATPGRLARILSGERLHPLLTPQLLGRPEQTPPPVSAFVPPAELHLPVIRRSLAELHGAGRLALVGEERYGVRMTVNPDELTGVELARTAALVRVHTRDCALFTPAELHLIDPDLCPQATIEAALVRLQDLGYVRSMGGAYWTVA